MNTERCGECRGSVVPDKLPEPSQKTEIWEWACLNCGQTTYLDHERETQERVARAFHDTTRGRAMVEGNYSQGKRSYPLPIHDALSQARQSPAQRQTADPISEDAILQALAYPGTDYFITTSMYWDCECETAYHRPRDMDLCENCGTFQEDGPDSRINELRLNGIHLDLIDNRTIATLEQHSSGSRRRGTAHRS